MAYIDLNRVLHELTHLGIGKYPMNRPRLHEHLLSMGLNWGEEVVQAAEEMLILAGHIEYVLHKGRGAFVLKRPQARKRDKGDYVMSGARGHDLLGPAVATTTEEGVTWNVKGATLTQPDLLIVTTKELDSVVDIERVDETGMPDGDLVAWESALPEPERMDSPIINLDPDNSRIFNPDTLSWAEFAELNYVFKTTGPVFLIRRMTSSGKDHLLITRDSDDNWKRRTVPPGREALSWARLMVLSAYGKTALTWNGGNLEYDIRARPPLSFERALVDLTGRLPEKGVEHWARVSFKGVSKELADQLRLTLIESFISTEIYLHTKQGDT